jgi:cytochrome c
MKNALLRNAGCAALFALLASSAVHAAADDAAAKSLAQGNDCFKCHAVDKPKKGPSLVKIAAKYKGRADAQEQLITNFTTGPLVKLPDGSEEKHKIVNTKDTKALKNLAEWILSQ